MRKWLKRAALAAAVVIGLPTIALAYAEFQALSSTPGISCANGDCSIGAMVMMWVNGSGQAVGASAANPMPAAVAEQLAPGSDSKTKMATDGPRR